MTLDMEKKIELQCHLDVFIENTLDSYSKSGFSTTHFRPP
jgi:hypothetical protein